MCAHRFSDLERQRAIQAAQGLIPFDLLLTGGVICDMVTGELRPADVGICGSLIASVHPQGSRHDAHEIHDLQGAYLAPGLIDTHVHIESSHLLPARYADVVVAQGTTTVFWDPHELANVMGIAGVRYAVDSTRDLPLRVLIAAPSCVPSTPGLELSGADFMRAEMETLLSWPEVSGVAEVMDMGGVLQGSERMQGIMSAGLASGKLITGHGRGLRGAALQGYLAAGVTSDHELTSAEDLLEKLRAGMILEIRGSHPYLLSEFVAALRTLPYLSSHITLCTDDVPPDQLLQHGGMIALVNRLIAEGLSAIEVLRMATLNAAQRLQRPELGLIAAGRVADLMVFTDLEQITAKAVYTQGKKVAENGLSLTIIEQTAPAEQLAMLSTNTFHLPAREANDFEFTIPAISQGQARLRVIKGARFTQWDEITVDIQAGKVIIPDDFSLISVQHRHGRHAAPVQLALLTGWGEVEGAIATSYSHDSHNVVIIGRDPHDMALAHNTLRQHGGGMVLVKNQQVISVVPMPVAGILSELPAEQLAESFHTLRERSAEIVQWEPPYRMFKAIEGTCLACNAGPHLTDLGLTDGSTRSIIDPVISAWETVKATSGTANTEHTLENMHHD